MNVYMYHKLPLVNAVSIYSSLLFFSSLFLSLASVL